MTLVAENTAEGGTNGSAVTAGGTGSGNAWDSVVNTSGVITWDNTHVDYGSLAIKVAMTGAVCRCTWSSTTLGTRTELYYAGDFYFTGSPSSSCHFVEGVTSAAAQAWTVDIASTGKMFVRNAANTNLYTSTNSIPVNTWCRVEVHYVAGTSTGTLQVRLSTGYTDSTALEDTGVLTTNTGADTSSLYIGAMTGSTALPAYWAGDQRVGDAAGGWLGPLGVVGGPAALSAGATLSGGGQTGTSASPGLTASANLAATAAGAGGAAGFGAGAALTAGGAPTPAASPSLAASATLTAIGQTQIVRALLDGTVKWPAHRGGYASTLGEETLEAYTAAASQYSKAILEVSIWDTSDGVYVCSHDQTTGRVFSGTNYTITSTTWATLSPGGASTAGRPTTITGGNPLRRLEEILDAFPTRLFVVENKHGTNQAALSSLLDAHAAGRWMFKGPYNDTTNANTAAGHGAPMWLYFYPSQLGSLSTTYSAVSAGGVPVVFGLGDYASAPVPVQSDANTFFSFTSANGVLTWAHVIGSTTQRATADGQATTAGQAFNGYMTSAYAAVAPTDGAASGPAALTAAAVLSAPGQLSAGGAAALSAGAALTLVSSPAIIAGSTGFGAGATLSTTAAPSATAAAAVTAGAALVASGQPGVTGSAAVAAGAQLTTAGKPAVNQSAVLATGAALTAASTPVASGSPAIQPGALLAATGGAQDTAATALSAGATLAGAGTPQGAAAVALTASTALAAAAGQPSTSTAPALTAGAALAATGLASSATGGSANLATGAALATGATSSQRGPASLATGVTLASVGALGGAASPSFSASTVLATGTAAGLSTAVALTSGAALATAGTSGGGQGISPAAGATLTVIGGPGGAFSTFTTAGTVLTVVGRADSDSTVPFSAGVLLSAFGAALIPAELIPDIVCRGWIEQDRWAGAIEQDRWAAYLEPDHYAGILEAP